MPRKGWGEFLLYLARIFILLILLAFLLPKLVSVWGGWFSSLEHNEQKPSGNPMRVENNTWSEFVIQLFPQSHP